MSSHRDLNSSLLNQIERHGLRRSTFSKKPLGNNQTELKHEERMALGLSHSDQTVAT